MTQISDKQTSTKATLVEAATAVFSECGLKGATTKEIAKRAGVHETTLFRHFETKEALLLAVLQHMSQEMMQALQQNHTWTDNLYEDLLGYGYIFRDAMLKNNALVRMLVSEGSESQEICQRIVMSSHLSFKEHLIAYIEQAKLLGQIRPELDAQKIGRIYTGMIFAAVLRGDVCADDKRKAGDVPSVFVSLEENLDVLINGIAAVV